MLAAQTQLRVRDHGTWQIYAMQAERAMELDFARLIIMSSASRLVVHRRSIERLGSVPMRGDERAKPPCHWPVQLEAEYAALCTLRAPPSETGRRPCTERCLPAAVTWRLLLHVMSATPVWLDMLEPWRQRAYR